MSREQIDGLDCCPRCNALGTWDGLTCPACRPYSCEGCPSLLFVLPFKGYGVFGPRHEFRSDAVCCHSSLARERIHEYDVDDPIKPRPPWCPKGAP